ncbi:uncharacterized protein LOC119262943 isoform X2 [Pygocentrus nattereri]|uniref:uncharacterized protein LOC119262943 isoform X2 n=1 Tax=Pygocentrus nattereri TaxID=42514 RepID=UPI0018914812|nr:uncharacterized protein LOC119262943 isoform X2 [Pygocentrus nattereri]
MMPVAESTDMDTCELDLQQRRSPQWSGKTAVFIALTVIGFVQIVSSVAVLLHLTGHIPQTPPQRYRGTQRLFPPISSQLMHSDTPRPEQNPKFRGKTRTSPQQLTCQSNQPADMYRGKSMPLSSTGTLSKATFTILDITMDGSLFRNQACTTCMPKHVFVTMTFWR